MKAFQRLEQGFNKLTESHITQLNFSFVVASVLESVCKKKKKKKTCILKSLKNSRGKKKKRKNKGKKPSISITSTIESRKNTAI